MKNPVKIVIFLLIAGVFVGAAEYFDQTPAGKKFNQKVFLEILCGNTEGIDEPKVTYVGFTDDYRDPDEDPWPPSRLDWDVILNRLGPGTHAEREAAAAAAATAAENGEGETKKTPRKDFHNAPVVGIVPSLNWRHDPADENDVLARKAMKDFTLRLTSLVVGATLGPEGSSEAQDIDLEVFQAIDRVEGDASKVPDAGKVVNSPDDALIYVGKAAFTNIELTDLVESTENGVRIPILARTGEQLLAGFALQVILEKEKLGTDNVKVRFDAEGGAVVEIFKEDANGEETEDLAYSIPVDEQGRLLVFDGVRTLELYPTLDAVDDLILYSSEIDAADDVAKTSQEDIDSLGKNAVVIGFDTEDLRQFELPNGDQVSRAELMAMAVATVQSGRYIKLWPQWMRWAALGGFVLLGILLIPTRAVEKVGIFLSLIILVGYLALSLVTFQSNLTWTPPLAGIGICLALAITGLVLPKGSAAAKPEAEEKPAEEEKKAETEPKPEAKAEESKEESKDS